MQLDNVRAWETPETEKASLTGSRRNDRRLMRIHTFCARFQSNSETAFSYVYFPVKSA